MRRAPAAAHITHVSVGCWEEGSSECAGIGSESSIIVSVRVL